MITIQDIGKMLTLLESNYGKSFYDGVDKDNVIKTWAIQFRNDDPVRVMKGVQNCINTMDRKPTIASIREQMPKTRKQMTEIEAFQRVKAAVRKATDRTSAVIAYNELPGILRKVVGNAEQLRDWQSVEDGTFETVIASLIMRTYRELARQEEIYYNLPEHLQDKTWETPEPEALPEPKHQKTVDEILEESYDIPDEYKMVMTPELQAKHAARLQQFITPMTEQEKKAFEQREEEALKRRLSEF